MASGAKRGVAAMHFLRGECEGEVRELRERRTGARVSGHLMLCRTDRLAGDGTLSESNKRRYRTDPTPLISPNHHSSP